MNLIKKAPRQESCVEQTGSFLAFFSIKTEMKLNFIWNWHREKVGEMKCQILWDFCDVSKQLFGLLWLWNYTYSSKFFHKLYLRDLLPSVPDFFIKNFKLVAYSHGFVTETHDAHDIISNNRKTGRTKVCELNTHDTY